jgi:hypothetical protein
MHQASSINIWFLKSGTQSGHRCFVKVVAVMIINSGCKSIRISLRPVTIDRPIFDLPVSITRRLDPLSPPLGPSPCVPSFSEQTAACHTSVASRTTTHLITMKHSSQPPMPSVPQSQRLVKNSSTVSLPIGLTRLLNSETFPAISAAVP